MAATSTAASELPEFPWPKETMTVAELAATIGRTPKTVRQHIQAKRLRVVQFDEGGPYSIHRDDAQAWGASFVVGQQAREGLDRMVNRRRAGLAGTPRPGGPRGGGSRR